MGSKSGKQELCEDDYKKRLPKTIVALQNKSRRESPCRVKKQISKIILKISSDYIWNDKNTKQNLTESTLGQKRAPNPHFKGAKLREYRNKSKNDLKTRSLLLKLEIR